MNKKKALLIVFFLSAFISSMLMYNFFRKSDFKSIKTIKKTDSEITEKQYNEYVITKRKSKIYKKSNGKFIMYGEINKNVKLHLEKNDSMQSYFKVMNSDFYIRGSDIKGTDKFEVSDRYKNYIYFDKNIKTITPTIFYDEDNNELFSVNESFDFKILVMDEDRYGVEYNNHLFYIHNDSVDNIYDNENGETNKDKIRTLTYHFIYDPETDECNQEICHTLEQFESELKYIRENNYFTLKLDELEMYLDGKINIPDKSIVLTVDDGTLFNLKALDLLEKYKVNLTMFVITSFVSNIDSLKSNYLDLESHTHNMHNQYECPGYGMQGGGILCLPEEQVLNDLKTSQDILGGSKYFAYPFFDVNDRAIKLLKEAGFKLAFIGQYDTEGYSYKDRTDHYKLRRMSIFNNTDLDEFISYLE